MDDGVRDAFCPILWKYNGGAIGPDGQPKPGACRYCSGVGNVNGDECEPCDGSGHDQRTRARGYCTRCYDCANCSLLQQELSYVPPNEQHWLCSDCVQEFYDAAKTHGFKILVPGFYVEALCQGPNCKLQGSVALGIPPRYSLFIQLVIGPSYKR